MVPARRMPEAAFAVVDVGDTTPKPVVRLVQGVLVQTCEIDLQDLHPQTS